MNSNRIRIRFAKEGDLRFIGHLDLVRVFERLFRRVGVPLAMSQGFHPRPQFTIPEALSVGTAGLNEVADVVLTHSIDLDEVTRRMQTLAPPGLTIHDVQALGPEDRKARVARTIYQIPIPPQRLNGLAEAVQRILQSDTLTIQRKEKQVVINLKETLDGLSLQDGVLHIAIRLWGQSQIQPRDLLASLGLQDILLEGSVITRTKVELLPT